jgi:hypothetical protein
VLAPTLLALALTADPFAVLEVPDAGWTYVERGPDAGTATHTWTTREVTHLGPYTSVTLQGDDVLPTVRVFVGPRGLSAVVDPTGSEPQTAAAIGRYWSRPQWGLFLPATLAAGVKVSYQFADPQLTGTLKGTLKARAEGGVEVISAGRVCFMGENCEQHTVELAFQPGVGFTHLCLDGAPACFELSQ